MEGSGFWEAVMRESGMEEGVSHWGERDQKGCDGWRK